MMKKGSNLNINSAAGRIRTDELVRTGLFTAILCVMSQLSIPVQPIPFSFALFSIFLTGALLSPRSAFLAVLTYILLGAFGLPVYAGGKCGLQALAGMTGGYLMAYPFMSLITALFYKYIKRRKLVALSVGMVVSLALCYLVGTLWFTFVAKTNFYYALSVCVLPFLLFDLMKIVLAVSVSTVFRRLMQKIS
jgi:biotin transport system substrate-specific component